MWHQKIFQKSLLISSSTHSEMEIEVRVYRSNGTIQKASFMEFLPNKTRPRRIYCSGVSPSKQSNRRLDLVSLFRIVPEWADRIKERGMQKKRTLYNHETWVQHRSSFRHARHVLSSFSSRVVLSLIPPVIAFTAFAVVIAVYNTAVEVGYFPGCFPILRGSSLPFQLTAPALALLLVFRTEASYSRYEEGRKAWTRIISGVHDLASVVIAVADAAADSPIKRSLLSYISAFPVVLKCHLIYGSDVERDLRNEFELDDMALILESKHRPRCVVSLISQSLQLLHVEESKKNFLQSKIACFHEGIAICEQLIGIPIPLSYTRLTSRFLVLWHLGLPIVLWDDCHWIVVPATFISAASLFCIEEVGVLIEEPFPMLALDELCMVVRSNIEEAIASEQAIKSRLEGKKDHACQRSPNGWPITREAEA